MKPPRTHTGATLLAFGLALAAWTLLWAAAAAALLLSIAGVIP